MAKEPSTVVFLDVVDDTEVKAPLRLIDYMRKNVSAKFLDNGTYYMSIALAVSLHLQVTRAAVYYWFEQNRIPSRYVNPLLTIPGNTFTRDDLLNYVDLG